MVTSMILMIFWMKYFLDAGHKVVDSISHLKTLSSAYLSSLAVSTNVQNVLGMHQNLYLREGDDVSS
jgi:hypothetical protein